MAVGVVRLPWCCLGSGAVVLGGEQIVVEGRKLTRGRVFTFQTGKVTLVEALVVAFLSRVCYSFLGRSEVEMRSSWIGSSQEDRLVCQK